MSRAIISVNRFFMRNLMQYFLSMSYQPVQLMLASMDIAWGVFFLFVAHPLPSESMAYPWSEIGMITMGILGFGVLLKEKTGLTMFFAVINFLFWSHKTWLVFADQIHRFSVPVLALFSAWLFLRMSAYESVRRRRWLEEHELGGTD